MDSIYFDKPSYSNFIQDIINKDLVEKKWIKKIHTRFPPEPNGYLHIGHAKSICLNFGIAKRNNGICNLRFDDTNPIKEEMEYVESIMEDVKWLGFDWEDRLYYASDYFDQMFDFAVELIKKGHAYICELTADEIRQYRGTLTEPGKNSPYRDRPIDENLDLFYKMRDGYFEDGKMVLRAKIDMESPNLNMRDPVMYRILRADHHRTLDRWIIYPMYDYAHPLSDYIEGITHSICTLEFEDHRILYEWFLDALELTCQPQQIEFARLNINYTVMSKRKLLRLVQGGFVSGWDDPRMPTISGLRRRGYTPSSIRDFADRIGVSKNNSVVDVGFLESCIREELNREALRMMVVMRPLKVVIDNYPEDQEEWFETKNNPEDPDSGVRKVPFTKTIFIERDDFMEDPPRKFFRLSPGREVRLINAYFITCNRVIKDENTGEIIQLHCTYDPKSKGGSSPDGRKVRGTLHWVSEKHAKNVQLRLYDNLFTRSNPDDERDGKTFMDHINGDSLEVLKDSKAEPSIDEYIERKRFQFLRNGYFYLDEKDSTPEDFVFNRIVTLKDTWAKVSGKKR